MRRTLRHVRRLRSLSETECYVRLYGGWDSTVTLVKIEPRRPRYELSVSGEDLRRDFEARIESRTDELMVELDAAEAAAVECFASCQASLQDRRRPLLLSPQGS